MYLIIIQTWLKINILLKNKHVLNDKEIIKKSHAVLKIYSRDSN
jgi:hypothetical protein